MSAFYTNVFHHKGRVYVRGLEDGKPFKRVAKYKPYLFVPAKGRGTKFRTLDGDPVDRVDFDSTWEAREFIKRYENVAGFPIYGLTNWTYLAVYDWFRGCEHDAKLISRVGLDIETKVGREDIATAIATTPNEVTAITISRDGRYLAFGCGDWTPDDPRVEFVKCRDEADLLKKFVEAWESEDFDPDVVTGWNIEFFDIPYLVGRIVRVLGEEWAERLSPWKMIEPYEVEVKGRRVGSYRLLGLTVLDYMAVYKKFILKPRESYKLDYIAQVELDVKKVDYRGEGYSGLNDLYDRNFQLFMKYNVRDVELIDRLEDKLRLLELAYTMAYEAGVNYIDVLGSVVQWDTLIHGYLLDRGIVVPQHKRKSFTDFVGGYVKEPIPGKYRWVVSFDLNSLYPHLIRQYNISPETLVGRLSNFPTIEQILNGAEVPDNGYSIAANGCQYRKDILGFLPEIMRYMYDRRVINKKKMLEAEQQYEDTHEEKYKILAGIYNNIQHAAKILLNSAYGALGSIYFRWFDINNAEAITTSGQLSIQWIAVKVNDKLNKVVGTTNKDRVIASDTDSVTGDTLIDVDGKNVRIDEYFNSKNDYLKRDEFNHDYVKSSDDETTLSLNKNGELERKTIKYVMKHKVKKNFYEIRCNGSKVVVTEDHSIVVKDKRTNVIKSISPKDLSTDRHFLISIIRKDTDSEAHRKTDELLQEK